MACIGLFMDTYSIYSGRFPLEWILATCDQKYVYWDNDTNHSERNLFSSSTDQCVI
jgi:hypothetical protein